MIKLDTFQKILQNYNHKIKPLSQFRQIFQIDLPLLFIIIGITTGINVTYSGIT